MQIGWMMNSGIKSGRLISKGALVFHIISVDSLAWKSLGESVWEILPTKRSCTPANISVLEEIVTLYLVMLRRRYVIGLG